MLSFGSPKAGEKWDIVEVEGYGGCQSAGAVCRFEAKVAGTENIETPAGKFEATKVVVDLNGKVGGANSPPTWRQLTYWYAAAAKRVVKVQVRSRSGPNMESDYDVELLKYKLN
jgi:hypothetical protein